MGTHGRLWLGTASLVLVLLVFLADIERASPGPLAPSHAGEVVLTAPGSCKQCHGERGETMASACGECHDDIARGVAEQTGFHGSLPEGASADCARCHPDHHGEELPLAGALAFSLAGVEDVENFDHGHLDFDLHGRHADLACTACHEHAEVPFLTAGQARFSGLAQDCAECHEDPHEGRFARGCETCHGQEQPFAALASFVHGESFPLVGAHGRPGCLDCHEAGSSHAVEALAGFEDPPPERGCAGCHASEHDPRFLAGVASLASTGSDRTCALCHDAVHESFAGDVATMQPALHAASGFELAPPHAELACEACHGADDRSEGFRARFPGRRADACEACHVDPHAGQWIGGPFEGEGCLACHDRHRFEPPAFDAVAHARTGFALVDAHADVSCEACHVDVDRDSGMHTYGGTSSACAACHEDAHGGALVSKPSDEGCATCHVATAFAEVDRGAFEHGARTRFELDGAHARSSCEACHPPTPRDALGRTFGRVANVYQGPLDRCETCHSDVHRSAFERAGLPGRVEGRAGCARCHVTEDFRDLRGDLFDHGPWTGFALEGAHDAIACQSCHGPAEAASGRSIGFVAEVFPGRTNRCETCHVDVHEGRFDGPGQPAVVAGRAGCARCHDTSSFRQDRRSHFDHGLWADLELEGPHARLDCAACHVLPRADARGMSLGRTRGSACSACHADPHAGQFSSAGATDCARCHAVADTFSALTFDHGRDSRFPLDASHEELDCAACHRPWPVPGGGETVRYKPLGTECVDCHAAEVLSRRKQ